MASMNKLDDFVHNSVVRLFFGFALGAIVLILMVFWGFYIAPFETRTVLIATGAAFSVGILIGPDRAERILEFFKMFIWMGVGNGS